MEYSTLENGNSNALHARYFFFMFLLSSADILKKINEFFQDILS